MSLCPRSPSRLSRASTDRRAPSVKYYASARLILQDVAECRDMISLQSLLFMILFLQASGNLSGCYVFIGIALRTALRIGLHRQLPHAGITPIEDETRRRVFHVIRLIDIYVSAVLGFPMLLRDEDVDQALPTEVDDQYVTETAILQTPANSPSVFQAFNAHVKLMNILKRVVRDVYPLKGMDQTVVNGERRYTSYSISFAAIKAIEGDLQRWSDELPEFWRPSPVGPLEVIRYVTGFAQRISLTLIAVLSVFWLTRSCPAFGRCFDRHTPMYK